MSWSLLCSTGPSGRTFTRPLALNETSFYIDRTFNGTADIVWQYVLRESDRTISAALFSENNVKRAWATLKQWYPLLGARMDDSDGVEAVKFVVAEHALSHHHPDEVTFGTISSSAEVEALISSLIRDDPMQDHHLIARLFVFARGDSPGTYEVLFRVSHVIADGLAGANIARTFFDVLASPPVHIPGLHERLAMALPYNRLNPTLKMNAARQRWRRAAARIIFLNRRRKLTGGHTIPRAITDRTYRTPSITGSIGFSFTLAESIAILNACKKHRITFGTVIPVISQLALTRVLHRRYFRGDITEDEWEYRRRQPVHYGGPINLRPYMDMEWQRRGGATEVQLSIDFYECTLPFMPTPYGVRRDEGILRVDGAPPYSVLMSPARFFHRAGLFKAQIQRVVRNPLVLDIAYERQPSYILRKKTMAMHWLAEKKGGPLPEIHVPPYYDKVPADYVPANGLSSVGQMSLILPENYPLPPGHPLSVCTPRAADPKFNAVSETSVSRATVAAPAARSPVNTLFRIVDSKTHLHSRPFEFFLGNSTDRNCIRMHITFDANVYRQEDMVEFLRECREATLHYLGDDTTLRGKL